jgi:hypothetical protein
MAQLEALQMVRLHVGLIDMKGNCVFSGFVVGPNHLADHSANPLARFSQVKQQSDKYRNH